MLDGFVNGYMNGANEVLGCFYKIGKIWQRHKACLMLGVELTAYILRQRILPKWETTKSGSRVSLLPT